MSVFANGECCVCVACRAAGSPAEEAQEDVHRENGQDAQPVEEHRGAVRQLVSVHLVRARVHVCVGALSCCPTCSQDAALTSFSLGLFLLLVFFPPLLSYHHPDTRCFSLP